MNKLELRKSTSGLYYYEYESNIDRREKLSPHFGAYEFICKSGELHTVRIAVDVITLLEVLRWNFGLPITITSAFRTWDYHKSIYKKLGKPVVKNSQHIQKRDNYDEVIRPCTAVDVLIGKTIPTSQVIADVALGVGFTGRGITKDSFTHLDLGPERDWKY